MHTIKERPVVVNGQIVIRPIMVVALTYDHRLLDGREATTFLGPYSINFMLPLLSNAVMWCSQAPGLRGGPAEDAPRVSGTRTRGVWRTESKWTCATVFTHTNVIPFCFEGTAPSNSNSFSSAVITGCFIVLLLRQCFG